MRLWDWGGQVAQMTPFQACLQHSTIRRKLSLESVWKTCLGWANVQLFAASPQVKAESWVDTEVERRVGGGTGSGHQKGPRSCCCFYFSTSAVCNLWIGCRPTLVPAVASVMLSHRSSTCALCSHGDGWCTTGAWPALALLVSMGPLIGESF